MGYSVSGSFAVCLLLAGCGAEDGTARSSAGTFHAAQTCGLSVAIEGGMVASYTGADTEFACLNPIGPTGIHTIYVAVEGTLGHFQLDASGIDRGMTGTELPAEVRLIAKDESGTWDADDCSIDVEQNVYLRKGEIGDQYRVVGSGRCLSPASPLRGGAAVTIAPFDFVLTMSWVGGS